MRLRTLQSRGRLNVPARTTTPAGGTTAEIDDGPETHTGHPRRQVALSGHGVWIDEQIADLVVALNTAGVQTISSCQQAPTAAGGEAGFVLLANPAAWVGLLERLFNSADHMSDPELTLLATASGASVNGVLPWDARLMISDGRDEPYVGALPGRIATPVHLVPRLLLRFPGTSALPFARLVEQHS